jgi:hypothetical protein
MAETAVERRGVSIALACRAFVVSETCYRYSLKLKDENEVIADLLTGLIDARARHGDLACVSCICGTSKVTPGTTNACIGSTTSWN